MVKRNRQEGKVEVCEMESELETTTSKLNDSRKVHKKQVSKKGQ